MTANTSAAEDVGEKMEKAELAYLTCPAIIGVKQHIHQRLPQLLSFALVLAAQPDVLLNDSTPVGQLDAHEGVCLSATEATELRVVPRPMSFADAVSHVSAFVRIVDKDCRVSYSQTTPWLFDALMTRSNAVATKRRTRREQLLGELQPGDKSAAARKKKSSGKSAKAVSNERARLAAVKQRVDAFDQHCQKEDFAYFDPLNVAASAGARATLSLADVYPPLASSLSAPEDSFVGSLDMSTHNPPPRERLFVGDLFYLDIFIAPKKRRYVCVTAAAHGFFVNRSSEREFDPTPLNEYTSPLLWQVLANFAPHIGELMGAFEAFAAQRTSREWQVGKHSGGAQRFAAPFVAPPFEKQLKAKEMRFRGWNGETYLQTRSFDHGRLSVLAQQYFSPAYSSFYAIGDDEPNAYRVAIAIENNMSLLMHEFVLSATSAIADLNLLANESGDPNLFFYGGVLISRVGAAANTYLAQRMDGATPLTARKLAGNDFRVLARLAPYMAPLPKLPQDGEPLVLSEEQQREIQARNQNEPHIVLAVIIDYGGERFLCQTTVSDAQSLAQVVTYGSLSAKAPLADSDQTTLDAAAKVARRLRIKPHTVEKNGKQATVPLGVDAMGVRGTDNRLYFLDFGKTMPHDIGSKEIAATHRPELVNWYITKKEKEMREEKKKEQEKNNNDDDNDDNDDDNDDNDEEEQKEKKKEEKKKEEPEEQKKEEKEEKKEEENSSLSNGDSEKQLDDEEKQVGLQTLAFMTEMAEWWKALVPGMRKRLTDGGEEAEEAFQAIEGEFLNCDSGFWEAQDESDAKKLSDFLLNEQVPLVAKSLSLASVVPLDGEHLCSILHEFGVPLRYLARVYDSFDVKRTLSAKLVLEEMVVRAAKHCFHRFWLSGERAEARQRGAPQTRAVEHFLNCLFGGAGGAALGEADGAALSGATSALTSEALWRCVLADLKDYFGFVGPASVEAFREAGVNGMRMLRNFARRVGVQVRAKPYALWSATAPAFAAGDVTQVYAQVKSLEYQSPFVSELVYQARMSLQLFREANVGGEVLEAAMSRLTMAQSYMSDELSTEYSASDMHEIAQLLVDVAGEWQRELRQRELALLAETSDEKVAAMSDDEKAQFMARVNEAHARVLRVSEIVSEHAHSYVTRTERLFGATHYLTARAYQQAGEMERSPMARLELLRHALLLHSVVAPTHASTRKLLGAYAATLISTNRTFLGVRYSQYMKDRTFAAYQSGDATLMELILARAENVEMLAAAALYGVALKEATAVRAWLEETKGKVSENAAALFTQQIERVEAVQRAVVPQLLREKKTLQAAPSGADKSAKSNGDVAQKNASSSSSAKPTNATQKNGRKK